MPRSNRYFIIQDCTPREAWRIRFTILFLIVFSLANIYFNPYKLMFEFFHIHSVNGCPLLTFTGVPCPTCGMGRSFSCLTDFHIAQSFYNNPSGLVFFLITGVLIAYVLWLSFKRKKIVLTKAIYKLWYIPVTALIIMWILNILYGHHG